MNPQQQPPINNQNQMNPMQQYAAPPVQPAQGNAMFASPVRYIVGKAITGPTGIAQMTFDGQNIYMQDIKTGQTVASWPLQNTVGYTNSSLVGASIKYNNQKIMLNSVTWHPLLFGLPTAISSIVLVVGPALNNFLLWFVLYAIAFGYGLGIFLYQRSRSQSSGLSNLLNTLSTYGVQKKFFLN